MRTHRIVSALLILALSITLPFSAQGAKKAKLRLSAKYIKVMNEGSYVEIKARAKGDDGMVSVPNVHITAWQDTEDSSILLGEVTTNGDGEVDYPIPMDALVRDTSGIFLLRFEADGGEWYRGAEKELQFMDCVLQAELLEDEGAYSISITLTDVKTGEAAMEQPIFVGVERLFKPLPVGDGLYETDEDGMVLVDYEDSIPSMNGQLTFIVRVEDSDLYGTVRTRFTAPIGAAVEREDTFDERTMWSPNTKTPIYLWIFPNLLILGVWSTIIYLIFNLIKIKKTN